MCKLITVAAWVAASPLAGIVAAVADSDRVDRVVVAVDPQLDKVVDRTDRSAGIVDPQLDKVADRVNRAVVAADKDHRVAEAVDPQLDKDSGRVGTA